MTAKKIARGVLAVTIALLPWPLLLGVATWVGDNCSDDMFTGYMLFVLPFAYLTWYAFWFGLD